MEGFICANCALIFNTQDNLLEHFQKCQHRPAERFDGILTGEEKSSYLSGSSSTIDQPIEMQQIGLVSPLINKFLKMRRDFISNYIMVSNRAVIRLRKLMLLWRKNHWNTPDRDSLQEIVKWDLQKLSCHSCDATFSFIRRKYNCCICGVGICNSCCRSVDFSILLDIETFDSMEENQPGFEYPEVQVTCCGECQKIFSKKRIISFRNIKPPPFLREYKEMMKVIDEARYWSKSSSRAAAENFRYKVQKIPEFCEILVAKINRMDDDIASKRIIKALQEAMVSHFVHFHSIMDE